MPARLVAIDEGLDIPLDRAMVVVGRHPQCDARLDSLRVSRHHCCMTQDQGEVIVRDLGSTNGIRINGQRVEFGRLRPGDELSIAHIRYRLDTGLGHEATLAEGGGRASVRDRARELELVRQDLRMPSPFAVAPNGGGHELASPPLPDEGALALALHNALPAELAKFYQIKVVRQGESARPVPAKEEPSDSAEVGHGLGSGGSDEPPVPGPDAPEKVQAWRQDSSL